MYQPKPIDTSQVQLSSELKLVVERLAENVHDIWAALRISEHWQLGPSRDDIRKLHPDLVPFGELPDGEKEYDRRSVRETIRALLALGYSIQPSSPDPSAPADRAAQTAAEIARIDALGKGATGDILQKMTSLWRSRIADIWSQAVVLYQALGEAALRIGEPLFAVDIVQEGLAAKPGDVRLRQLQALGLARSGAARQACGILEDLVRHGNRDEETLGILARTHKDLADEALLDANRTGHLRTALGLYEQAYTSTGGYWSGINAATLALVLNQNAKAETLAREVMALCREEVARVKDAYWPLATLGEAAVILREWNAAEESYGRAVEIAGRRYGDLQTTRRNARRLLRCLDADLGRFDRLFSLPSVVLFLGGPHSGLNQEESLRLQSTVRDAVRKRLAPLNVGFSYASLSGAADMVFLEETISAGVEVHIVLPCEQTELIGVGKFLGTDPEVRQRCENILAKAADVTVASGKLKDPDAGYYSYADLLMRGLALLRAQQLETDVNTLSIGDQDASPQPLPTAELPAASAEEAQVCALLFADAVGFSRLSEEEVPRFARHFLGMVGELVETSPSPPLVRNTWGDGIFMVFANVRDAGQFALLLCERIAATDWASKGLPDLRVRIGLHAGPVHRCIDPLTGQENCIGAHVSRAARIEPITPPGHVYASEAVAALAAVEGVREFRCDYVGRVGMAKNYGVFRTYVLRRTPAAALDAAVDRQVP